MLRRGEASPHLAAFQRAACASDEMETEKAWLRRGGKAAAIAIRRCEEVMDKAWGMVATIEGQSGPLAADISAEHWLMGDDWQTVALAHALSVDKCKKLAYEAVKRLDEGHGGGRGRA